MSISIAPEGARFLMGESKNGKPKTALRPASHTGHGDEMRRCRTVIRSAKALLQLQSKQTVTTHHK
jgi:hypothetical protein